MWQRGIILQGSKCTYVFYDGNWCTHIIGHIRAHIYIRTFVSYIHNWNYVIGLWCYITLTHWTIPCTVYTMHMDMSVPLWVQSPQHVSHHRWHRIHLTIAACSEYIAQPEPRILFPGPESSYHSNVYMYIYTMHINKLAVSVPMYAQLWPLDLLVPEVLIVLPLSPAVCNLVENYMRFGHRWIHIHCTSL